MSDSYFVISVHRATKFFCQWKKRRLCAPYRGSSPASLAHRAPHVGHAAIWDGQENERHKRLSFEHTASHCYHQAPLVSKTELQPYAGSYHRCTNLVLHNFITCDPPVHQQPHSGSLTASLHTLIPVSQLSSCPNSPWVISCRTNPRTWAHTWCSTCTRLQTGTCNFAYAPAETCT